MRILRFGSFALAVLTFFSVGVFAQAPLSPPTDKKVISDFEKAAEYYGVMRDKLQGRMPVLSKDATPEQIQAHKADLQKSIQFARREAKQGELFTPSAIRLIRTIIKKEYVGRERAELRQTLLEADTKGVPLVVNTPYPEAKELVEMSPDLLLALPQLPKPLRYRFIGRSMAILDRDSQLIIDFMKEALP